VTRDLWVIEKRLDDGSLDLTYPQPEDYFGLAAIKGITSDAIAKKVYARKPEAVLLGDRIARWPSLLHPGFVARRKTW
jgi:hypothetical protein